MPIINSEMFEFKQEQMQAMFLSKLIPVLVDIQKTKSGTKKILLSRVEVEPIKIKTEWLHRWWSNLQSLMPEVHRMGLPSNIASAQELLAKISLNQSQKRLVLIDCVEFEGYYAQVGEKDNKITNLNEVKMNGDCKKEGEKTVARVLGIPDSSLDKLRKAIAGARFDYQETIKKILKVIMTGGVIGLFSWAAVPIIGAIIGTAVLGLHGAAALTAGLAWVGGGSLAAGGLGMAGGTAIIAGAGALVGIAGGGLASQLLHIDKASAIRNSVQLEMLIGIFILAEKDGHLLASQLYDEARNTYQKVFCLRDDVQLHRENKDVQEIFSQAKARGGAKFSEKDLRKDLVTGLNESLTVYGKMLDRIRAKLIP